MYIYKFYNKYFFNFSYYNYIYKKNKHFIKIKYMLVSVTHVGDINLIDYPFIIDNDIIIPKGWYLLDKNLENRPNIIYKKNNEVNILEHLQINHSQNKENHILSIIKTDKKLKVNDILTDIK